jgi:putative membrane protein
MHRRISHRRYLGILALIFAAIWIVLAVSPWDRADWAVENALVVLLAVIAFKFHRHIVFSRVSYTLLFLFFCLHAVGAHYSYASVPYDTWSRQLSGVSLNGMLGWQRNNFDRVVHFSYGFLLAYPVREVFLRVADVRGFWGYFLPFDLTLSTSAMFELIEWGVAEVLGGDLGAAYLGTQGDIWDAQKDMALAGTGAFIAMALTAAVNAKLRRDFTREWVESLRVKHPRPLGEDALRRMRHNSHGNLKPSQIQL